MMMGMIDENEEGDDGDTSHDDEHGYDYGDINDDAVGDGDDERFETDDADDVFWGRCSSARCAHVRNASGLAGEDPETIILGLRLRQSAVRQCLNRLPRDLHEPFLRHIPAGEGEKLLASRDGAADRRPMRLLVPNGTMLDHTVR